MSDFDPIGSVLGYVGQQETNAANQANALAASRMSSEEAQKNRAWQEMMSNTAYQRQVADLSAAGLNPMLAYIKGGGASTPSGSTGTVTSAQYTSPIQGALQGRLTSAQAAKTEAEKPQVEAGTKNVLADTLLKEAQLPVVQETVREIKARISKLGAEIDKTEAETENLVIDRDRLRASIELISKQAILASEQAKSEPARRLSLQASAFEAQQRGLITKAEYDMMVKTEFFGVAARELKVYSDIGSTWTDKFMPKNWFKGDTKSEEHENIIHDKDGRVVGRERYRSSSSR